MDILETREGSLRSKVLGSPSSHLASSTLIDRLLRLRNQVDQLSAVVSGSVKLRELYKEHSDLLHLTAASALFHSNAIPGDELKRATILSSAECLQHILAQLQQLQQLTSVLDQLRAPQFQQHTRFTRVETMSELHSERALAFHSRVEKMLATYRKMILILSEKCIEYSMVLEQLHVKEVDNELL